jgi:hypothetical protein
LLAARHEERIKVSEAGTLMGLGRRQVFRLAKGFGSAALRRWCHGDAGGEQPQLSEGVADRVVGIIRERYADFGPTLAGEKLAELLGGHRQRGVADAATSCARQGGAHRWTGNSECGWMP